MNNDVKPIKGTVIKDCEYKGLEFTLFGSKEQENLGFSKGSLYKSILTGKMLYGCKWERISRDEAEVFQRGLTKEQQKVIVVKRN